MKIVGKEYLRVTISILKIMAIPKKGDFIFKFL